MAIFHSYVTNYQWVPKSISNNLPRRGTWWSRNVPPPRCIERHCDVCDPVVSFHIKNGAFHLEQPTARREKGVWGKLGAKLPQKVWESVEFDHENKSFTELKEFRLTKIGRSQDVGTTVIQMLNFYEFLQFELSHSPIQSDPSTTSTMRSDRRSSGSIYPASTSLLLRVEVPASGCYS